jgi:hypothetical protein
MASVWHRCPRRASRRRAGLQPSARRALRHLERWSRPSPWPCRVPCPGRRDGGGGGVTPRPHLWPRPARFPDEPAPHLSTSFPEARREPDRALRYQREAPQSLIRRAWLRLRRRPPRLRAFRLGHVRPAACGVASLRMDLLWSRRQRTARSGPPSGRWSSWWTQARSSGPSTLLPSVGPRGQVATGNRDQGTRQTQRRSVDRYRRARAAALAARRVPRVLAHPASSPSGARDPAPRPPVWGPAAAVARHLGWIPAGGRLRAGLDQGYHPGPGGQPRRRRGAPGGRAQVGHFAKLVGR